MAEIRTYIVRQDYKTLIAGELVRVIVNDLNRMCAAPDRPVQPVLVDKDVLLPVSEYLKRQPKKGFFAIIQDPSGYNVTGAYLSNVELCRYSHNTPFRFESLGEARFFAKKKLLNGIIIKWVEAIST